MSQLTWPENKWLRLRARGQPNLRGILFAEPGHFHSPLLDVEATSSTGVPDDDAAMWESVDLRLDEQRVFYPQMQAVDFPAQPSFAARYYHDNGWFPLLDARMLASIISREKPARYLEVGSGFSTAVVLDTLDRTKGHTRINIIEPDLTRLRALLRAGDEARLNVHSCLVQEMSLEIFETLEAGDVLFIDSSHVAKAGSDVSFLFLRVLPRLKSGVWVHVHDIFYPESYPLEWVREGRAWNESLFLRAFLTGNDSFEVRAFNAMALRVFPNLLTGPFPGGGCSFWMQHR